MAKKKEVEIPLTHKIPMSRYFLARLVLNFKTEDSCHEYTLNRNATEPVFQIIDVLCGPEIPSELASGRYFVLQAIRKFEVKAHTPATTYTTEEEKVGE